MESGCIFVLKMIFLDTIQKIHRNINKRNLLDVANSNIKLTFVLPCVKISNEFLGGKTMKSFNSEKFCKELIMLRGEETQQMFSEKLGINRSTLSLLETGKQMPSLDILNRICSISDKNPGDYFVESDSDALIYLMGSLEETDKCKINAMMERIKTREKYEALARRCVDGIRR